MELKIFPDKTSMSKAAARQAGIALRRAIQKRGSACIIPATAASQFEFLEVLTNEPGIEWPRIELFQLDEYIGLPVTHPASFRRMLLDHLIHKTGITRYHLLNGDGNVAEVVALQSQAVSSVLIDVAFVGIGENGHLAFNDPPADFQTEQPYLVVDLDERCRSQQVGEGWFADLLQVPKQAISMSVRQILKAKEIIGVVPEERKAEAVKACFEGPISPMAPASILRTHTNATIYLDKHSASRLSLAVRSAAGSYRA